VLACQLALRQGQGMKEVGPRISGRRGGRGSRNPRIVPPVQLLSQLRLSVDAAEDDRSNRQQAATLALELQVEVRYNAQCHSSS
jgi:hypothetical protein